MIPFNLEQALAGKAVLALHPKTGKWEVIKEYHMIPKWIDEKYPFAVLFEDGEVDQYPLNSPSIRMLPEEKVWYVNEYEHGISSNFDCVKQAKRVASGNCIGQLRITRHHDGEYSIEKVK